MLGALNLLQTVEAKGESIYFVPGMLIVVFIFYVDGGRTIGLPKVIAQKLAQNNSRTMPFIHVCKASAAEI